MISFHLTKKLGIPIFHLEDPKNIWKRLREDIMDKNELIAKVILMTGVDVCTACKVVHATLDILTF